MADGQLVEFLPDKTPLWQKHIHQGDEVRVVGRVAQLEHLMHDDIFQALQGLFRQFGVQADGEFFRVAASTASLHPLDVESIQRNPQSRLPDFEQWLDGVFQLFPIPAFKQRATPGGIGRWG